MSKLIRWQFVVTFMTLLTFFLTKSMAFSQPIGVSILTAVGIFCLFFIFGLTELVFSALLITCAWLAAYFSLMSVAILAAALAAFYVLLIISDKHLALSRHQIWLAFVIQLAVTLVPMVLAF